MTVPSEVASRWTRWAVPAGAFVVSTAVGFGAAAALSDDGGTEVPVAEVAGETTARGTELPAGISAEPVPVLRAGVPGVDRPIVIYEEVDRTLDGDVSSTVDIDAIDGVTAADVVPGPPPAGYYDEPEAPSTAVTPDVTPPAAEVRFPALEVADLVPSDGSPPPTSPPTTATAGAGSVPQGPVWDETAMPRIPGIEPGDLLAPVLVDLCASETPPISCPGGLAGTVLLTDDAPLVVHYVSATPAESCADQLGEVRRDEIVLTVVSNRPGVFDLSYRSPEARESDVVHTFTPHGQFNRWRAGSTDVIETCVAVLRTDDARRFEVRVDGLAMLTASGGVDEELAGGWSGTVVVPASGRPPVSLRGVDDRLLEVIVPAPTNETVEVWTIRHEDGAFVERGCGRLEDLVAAGAGSVDRYPEVQQVSLPHPTGAWWDEEVDSLREFSVRLPGGGSYDLCVVWYEEFEPTPLIREREAWTVIPPALVTATIDVVGLGTSGHPGFPRPDGSFDGIFFNIESASGSLLCQDLVTAPTTGICSFEVTADRALSRVALQATGSPGSLPFRGALHLPGVTCGSSATCSEEFHLPVLVGAAGAPGALGTLVLRASYDDDGGYRARAGEWILAGYGAYGPEAERGPDHPQLNVAATTFTFDPANPFELGFHYEADRAVEVELTGVLVGGLQCDSSEVRPIVPTRGRGRSETGDLTVRACPGSRYAFEVLLTDAAGRSARYTTAPGGITDEVPSFAWPKGSVRTDPIEILVTYSARAGISNEPDELDDRVDGWEEFAHVSWYTAVGSDHSFSQDRWTRTFEGPRPSCYPIDDYDLSFDELADAPLRETVGPTLRVQARATVSAFWSCGSVWHDARSVPVREPTTAWFTVEVPLADLLDSGPQVVVSSHHVEAALIPYGVVEVTVRAEPVLDPPLDDAG